jgi:hypothetical protein
VTEVLGPGGAPPYRVRFEDDSEAMLWPGPDTEVKHPTPGPGVGQGVTGSHRL